MRTSCRNVQANPTFRVPQRSKTLTRSRPKCQLRLCLRQPCMERMQSKIPIPHPFSVPFSDVVLRSWGRVLAAVGSIQDLSKPLEPSRVNVLFVPDDDSSPLPVLVGGEPENVDEVRAKEILSEGKFGIKIQLGIGEESAKYWTCDFSYVSLSFLSSLLLGAFEICDVTGRPRVISPPPLFRFFSSISYSNRCTLCLLSRVLNYSPF